MRTARRLYGAFTRPTGITQADVGFMADTIPAAQTADTLAIITEAMSKWQVGKRNDA
jgi:hypothetical protein